VQDVTNGLTIISYAEGELFSGPGPSFFVQIYRKAQP
jgi:hypothetical protein